MTEPADDDMSQIAGTPAGQTPGSAVATPPAAETITWSMLHDHIPLSLIMDMTPPAGPRSQELCDSEGLPEQAWWEPR